MKLALVCGGPSQERGISLNSARSVMDHTRLMDVELVPFFVSQNLDFYQISPSQLYSNTPSDFDFKLAETQTPMDQNGFVAALKGCDLVFPCIHGAFGEDGTIQQILENHNIPFVGVGAQCARTMYFKNNMVNFLKHQGYPVLSSLHVERDDNITPAALQAFVDTVAVDRVVVKPVAGGSSIGVHSVEKNIAQITNAIEAVKRDTSSGVLIEPFCQGREFTVIVLQGVSGQAVPLMPTEIEISYEGGAIFDYRRKYLPTTNTFWHTPTRFEENQIDTIRSQAKDLFEKFDMRDFARLDGWLLDDGTIIFTDLNPISGMEQNSFIFQQTSRIGMSHADTMRHVLTSACARYDLTPPSVHGRDDRNKKSVYVLFGSKTAERQVSVMSGTNIWLKLMQSDLYAPHPYFIDKDGLVWDIPYSFALNHTVEEIQDNAHNGQAVYDRLSPYLDDIHASLLVTPSVNFYPPTSMSLDTLIAKAKDQGAFVFIGLHGGMGEDGRLQKKLEDAGVPFNGSGSVASHVCMDKEHTAAKVNALGVSSVRALDKYILSLEKTYSTDEIATIWNDLRASFPRGSFIIKPRSDGCSAGIVKINNEADIERYFAIINDGKGIIPANSFEGQTNVIELGGHSDPFVMIEPYIGIDAIVVERGELKYSAKEGWLEYTVGVIEQDGVYHVLSPSITVAETAVLTLEEKFQGGTGVNITPPPLSILPLEKRNHLRHAIAQASQALGVQNYARIDCFYNSQTDETVIIEANSLPGMTPSTVIYHQALAENPPIYPTGFIELLIGLKTHAVTLEQREEAA